MASGEDSAVWDRLDPPEVVGGQWPWILRAPGAGLVSWGDGRHDLLDGYWNGDSVAAAVAKGSIIVGNATPKWDVVAFPAAPTGYEYLLADDASGLPVWSAVVQEFLLGPAHGDTSNAFARGKGSIIISTDAAPAGAWAAMDCGADGSLLSVNGGLPVWFPGAEAAGLPLVYGVGGPLWYDGPTGTPEPVTGLSVDEETGHLIAVTTPIAIAKGIVTGIGPDGDPVDLGLMGVPPVPADPAVLVWDAAGGVHWLEAANEYEVLQLVDGTLAFGPVRFTG